MNIIKEFVKLQIADKEWINRIRKIKGDKNRKAILIGTPVHGNLGDHAIAEEEKNFLHDNFEKLSVHEVPMPMYHVFKKVLKKYITNNDVIFISGGGWMGNLWLHNEIVIREIIRDYLKNPIFIFPQTVYYTDDENGKKEIESTKNIISKHNNIHIFFRDMRSYQFAMKNYIFSGRSGTYLFPDMVLYNSCKSDNNIIKNKKLINLCLRDDCEAVLEDKEMLIEKLEKGYCVRNITTVIPKIVTLKNRKKELINKWDEFAEAQLTVTDRLHAMLFSVLNGTPCIAIDNKTGKVFGVLEWIKDSKMIYKASSFDEVIKLIPEIILLQNVYYKKNDLIPLFDEMANIIKRRIGDKND